MSIAGQGWSFRLTDSARRDYASILERTAEMFGARQAAIYQTTILFALDALKDGPDILGARAVDGAGQALDATSGCKRMVIRDDFAWDPGFALTRCGARHSLAYGVGACLAAFLF